MTPLPLTTAALLTFLLGGFTLMALAYSSPLRSPATIHEDESMDSGGNPSPLVISKSASTIYTHSTFSPRLLNIRTGSNMLSTRDHENLSDSLNLTQ